MALVIAIALVLVAYIALVLFGGRIPGRFLVLPFLPVWLLWLPELVWQARHGFTGWESWERLPAWLRLTRVVTYPLCLAIVAGVVVRFYLL